MDFVLTQLNQQWRALLLAPHEVCNRFIDSSNRQQRPRDPECWIDMDVALTLGASYAE